MSYSNPLVQCSRCDLGGDFGCPCCGGEGLVYKHESEDWIERDANAIDAMMADEAAEEEATNALMDWMIAVHPGGRC